MSVVVIVKWVDYLHAEIVRRKLCDCPLLCYLELKIYAVAPIVIVWDWIGMDWNGVAGGMVCCCTDS